MTAQGGPVPTIEVASGETRVPIIAVALTPVVTCMIVVVASTMFLEMALAIRDIIAKEMAVEKSVPEAGRHAGVHAASATAAACAGIDLRQG